MDRQEATAVLREILAACRELIEVNYVSLNPSDAQIRSNSGDYELYIKSTLTEPLRKCMIPILEKHQLRLKKLAGAICIYTPK
jgi:hypothetical protein